MYSEYSEVFRFYLTDTRKCWSFKVIRNVSAIFLKRPPPPHLLDMKILYDFHNRLKSIIPTQE